MYLDSEDKDTIKKSIKDYGAVTTHYNEYSRFSADDTHSYCPGASNYINGHCISVVGWDDNISKESFTVNIDGETYTPKRMVHGYVEIAGVTTTILTVTSGFLMKTTTYSLMYLVHHMLLPTI